MVNVSEKLKDIGKYAIGRGGEVRFKNEAEKYSKIHGVTPEQAEVAIVTARAQDIQREIVNVGTVDARSKNYRELLSSLQSMLDRKTLAQCRKDFSDASRFRNMSVMPPTPAELSRTQSHFARKFSGRVPANGVVRGSAADAKLLSALLARLTSDPRLSGMSFRDAIETNPDLAADIGGILESQRSVERHEKKFDGELRFETARDKFSDTARNTMTEMLWGAPIDFMSSMGKTVWGSGRRRRPLTLGGFTKELLGQSTRLAGREGWAMAKLLARTGYTAGSYARNRLMR